MSLQHGALAKCLFRCIFGGFDAVGNENLLNLESVGTEYTEGDLKRIYTLNSLYFSESEG